MLPGMDHPEAFGQHPNADITSQIQETRRMFETLLSLQAAAGASSSSDNREEKVSLRLFILCLRAAEVIGFKTFQKPKDFVICHNL